MTVRTVKILLFGCFEKSSRLIVHCNTVTLCEMTTKMASNMDDTIDGSQTQSQPQSLLDKDFVDAVMSPTVVKVDGDATTRKRPLSGEDTNSEDASKKIKASGSPKASGSSGTSTCSNFDIVVFMKSEFSALKSDLSAELNQSLDSKFDALGAKIVCRTGGSERRHRRCEKGISGWNFGTFIQVGNQVDTGVAG